MGSRIHWIPHIRLSHTQVSIDRFTDTVQADVSFSDEDRSSVALGIATDSARSAGGGELSLRASVHLEHHIRGTDTTAEVSGTRLRASTQDTGAILGLGAGWQKGPWILETTVSARQALDTDSQALSAALNLGMQF